MRRESLITDNEPPLVDVEDIEQMDYQDQYYYEQPIEEEPADGGDSSDGEAEPVKSIASPRPSLSVKTREVRYTVYAENLEQCLKLLTCQKTVSLLDKKDPKYKRMFITAT